MSSTGRELAGEVVLVVAEPGASLERIRLALHEGGYRTVVTRDSVLAASVAESRSVCAAIVEIGEETGSGYEVLDALRELPHRQRDCLLLRYYDELGIDDIAATLASSGHAVICDSPEQALAVSNHIAPEHLELQTADPPALLPLVRHAGAVFCGPWAPASLGDYVAGPSHVLPTNGTARFASALTVHDFMKDVHVVTVDESGFAAMADHVEALAGAEGLDAHAASIRIRRGAPS